MKIAIGTNYFGSYDRQTRAYECLVQLKCLYPELTLYDVQFEDDNSPAREHVHTLRELKRSSRDVVNGSDKKLPFINDIFNVLSNTKNDFFVFVNSDILVSPSLIRYINNFRYTNAMPCNRIDIYPINNIKDNMVPYRMEIGGFDAFVFNTDWYIQNSHLFEDFLMGSIWFDHHYAGIMKYTSKDKIGNMYPPFILHEMHEKNWSYEDPFAQYNAKQFNNSKYRYLSKPWDNYFASYLKNKRQNGFIFECDDEEQKAEKEAFV